MLSSVENIVTPITHQDAKHVFHLYVIRILQRSELQAYLKDNGISSGIHYPTPLPFLKAYKYLGYKPEDFPVAHDYQNKILSLPMYPELNVQSIKYIIDLILGFMNK